VALASSPAPKRSLPATRNTAPTRHPDPQLRINSGAASRDHGSCRLLPLRRSTMSKAQARQAVPAAYLLGVRETLSPRIRLSRILAIMLWVPKTYATRRYS
jgi:hypothetical protein